MWGVYGCGCGCGVGGCGGVFVVLCVLPTAYPFALLFARRLPSSPQASPFRYCCFAALCDRHHLQSYTAPVPLRVLLAPEQQQQFEVLRKEEAKDNEKLQKVGGINCLSGLLCLRS